MARFTVTPGAAAKLREMIATDRQGRSVVAVYWEAPKVDSRRGPNGETQWIREADGMWKVVLVTDEELEGQTPEMIDDLRFLLIERINKPKLTGCTLDHAKGGFVVR